RARWSARRSKPAGGRERPAPEAGRATNILRRAGRSGAEGRRVGRGGLVEEHIPDEAGVEGDDAGQFQEAQRVVCVPQVPVQKVGHGWSRYQVSKSSARGWSKRIVSLPWSSKSLVTPSACPTASVEPAHRAIKESRVPAAGPVAVSLRTTVSASLSKPRRTTSQGTATRSRSRRFCWSGTVTPKALALA